MYINLHKNGLKKQVKDGFSWTCFFFGIFVPIARGMWPQVLITLLTFGLANWFYIFKINGLYLEKLVEAGWEVQP